MAALMDFVNVDVTGFRGQLDALARAIVHGVNEYHASGWTAAGDALGGANWDPLLPPTGSRVDFFDAAGVTATSIQLSAAVRADVNVIAAGDVQNAPGNSAVALALSALRDSSGMAALETRLGAAFATQIGFATGVSYGDHYRSAVADVGLGTAQARQAESVHGVLAANAEQRRLNTSGVSLDEELTKMMQYQQAFVAATRVINAVDEMADALLSMV
jgi:flagellar hook-associated protein 1 FlgK